MLDAVNDSRYEKQQHENKQNPTCGIHCEPSPFLLVCFYIFAVFAVSISYSVAFPLALLSVKFVCEWKMRRKKEQELQNRGKDRDIEHVATN